MARKFKRTSILGDINEPVKRNYIPTSISLKPQTSKLVFEDLDKKKAQTKKELEQTCIRLEDMGATNIAEKIRKDIKF